MNPQPATTTPNLPGIRLFEPADGSQTLRQFFDDVVPIAPKQSTRNEHLQAIHRWDQFAQDLTAGKVGNLRTICPEVPMLGQIDTAMVAAFRDWMTATAHLNRLGKRGKATAGSANKSMVYVRSWLGMAADRGLTSPLGRTPRLAVAKGDHRIEIPAEHVDALMAACDQADWPNHWRRTSPAKGKHGERFGKPFSPALFWRVQIVWLWTFGQRRGDMVGMKSDNRPLAWANVIHQAENPHPNGSATNESGWLAFTQSKTSKDLVLPIPQVAAHWMDLIAATVPDRTVDDLILSVPRNGKSFYSTWRKIAEASGVRPKAAMKMVDGRPVMTDRVYQLKNFRSTAASAIEHHAGVGRLITGHASDAERRPDAMRSDVFATNYLSSERAVLDALSTMPLPASFTELLPA
ncbi:MAG: hypothetical protein AAF958_01350 [Planctomycetota bacterium]